MSKIISFFSLILAVNFIYSQPWSEQTSGVTTQLTSVSVIDDNNVWVCGYSGTVLRTTNHGINWLNVSGGGIPSTLQLINVFGINSSVALAAGYIGSDTWVYRTSNAGVNWVQVFAQTGGFINALYIRFDSTGFMAGDPVGGRWSLWKTVNSGATWDSTGLYLPQSGTETGYNNCLAVALNRIWFGTNNSRIYSSTNNGSNWSVQSSTPEASIYAIWFDINGSATGYCGGTNILKTTNYGVNWTSIGSLGTGNVSGITGLPMFGGNVWYVKSGNSNIYRGFGDGTWFVNYTAPAGTYRHIATDRIPSWPFNGFAVRTNGGISYTFIFVEKITQLGGELPESFSLSQNYPNPFNPATKIQFSLPAERELKDVRLVIFDILGREIASLVNEQLKPGNYEVEWDASNFPSGTYFYKLSSGTYTETKKMILLK